MSLTTSSSTRTPTPLPPCCPLPDQLVHLSRLAGQIFNKVKKVRQCVVSVGPLVTRRILLLLLLLLFLFTIHSLKCRTVSDIDFNSLIIIIVLFFLSRLSLLSLRFLISARSLEYLVCLPIVFGQLCFHLIILLFLTGVGELHCNGPTFTG